MRRSIVSVLTLIALRGRPFATPSSAFHVQAMAWRSHGSSNVELVSNLNKHGVIKSASVAQVLKDVDRADFVPTGEKAWAYQDQPLPIGHGATISAPHMHAHVLELLEPVLHAGGKALDVGSGTGILLAAFARMVQPGGKVYGIEHIPELVDMSVENLRKNPTHAAFLEDGTITVSVGDGHAGLPGAGPFDAIHVGAAAADIPAALVEQLAPGGRMIIPVGKWAQDLVQVDKKADGSVVKKALLAVQYVPLTTREKQEGRSHSMW